MSIRIEPSKLNTANAQINEMSRQWHNIRNQLDVILMGSGLKTAEARQLCLALNDLTNPEREEYIQANWGPLYLQKSLPLLGQLETIEQLMAKSEGK
jgi:hypothetical protein